MAVVVRVEDIQPLIEALKFYANKRNWGPMVRLNDPIVEPLPLAHGDRGQKARDALGEQPRAFVTEVQEMQTVVGLMQHAIEGAK